MSLNLRFWTKRTLPGEVRIEIHKDISNGDPVADDLSGIPEYPAHFDATDEDSLDLLELLYQETDKSPQPPTFQLFGERAAIHIPIAP